MLADWLSVDFVALTLLEYPISYLELIATIFGLVSVYLATKENIWTWPTGVVNEWGFFLLFFQVQLYADMFLQVVFFAITVFGWLHWRTRTSSFRIHSLSRRHFFFSIIGALVAAALAGILIKNLHSLAPQIFPNPAAHPFWDSLVMVTSILAIAFLARKILQAWILWIAVDVVSIVLFYSRSIHLVALEYVVFLVMAGYGYLQWRKQLVY